MAVDLQMRATSTAERTGFFAPRRLGHVNLFVGDIDRALDFYINIAGFEESYVQPLNRAGFVGNNNTHHDFGLIDVHGRLGSGRTPGLNHLAFELETETDLVAGYRRAIDDGYRFARTMDHDIAHSCYGLDSDGNQVEIYADVVHDWRSARSGVVTKAKPDWYPGLTPPNSNRDYHVNPEIHRVENAVFHPLRTAHAALVVADLGAAVRYYTTVVGLTLLAGGPQSAYAMLGGTLGDHDLSLFRAGPGRAPGFHHSGLKLANEAELDAGLARLRALGQEPELHIEHNLRRAVFLRDPDGIRLQFFVDRDFSPKALVGIDEDIALYLA